MISRSAARARMAVMGLSAVLLLTAAAAETYRQGGSTAIIEQGGDSQSQVRQSADGQIIITEDGTSTDITIQSEGHAAPLDDDDRDFIEQRFSDTQRRAYEYGDDVDVDPEPRRFYWPR